VFQQVMESPYGHQHSQPAASGAACHGRAPAGGKEAERGGNICVGMCSASARSIGAASRASQLREVQHGSVAHLHDGNKAVKAQV
jgi:hypothetical protein